MVSIVSARGILVLLSGGLDSATALARTIHYNGAHHVTAITIGYGQKHQSKEVLASYDIARHYNVLHYYLSLPELFMASKSALIQSTDGTIPEGTYEQLGTMPSTNVPFRNGIFLSIAAAKAMDLGAENAVVVYAAHRDDAEGSVPYPDCTEAFAHHMASAIRTGTGGLVNLEAPFINWTKGDIVKEGVRLGVPFHLTWSCYNGGELPCGKCSTCIDREKAFAANGMKDPLIN